MRTNKAGIEIIKKWEGFRANAYLCPSRVLTIGYGHTSRAGKPKVVRGMRITKIMAEEILRKDLRKYEKGVRDALGSSVKKLNENQFSACVSLCYNIGPGGFARSSIASYIKRGYIIEAAQRFKLYNKGGRPRRTIRGLVRRRNDEIKLYLR